MKKKIAIIAVVLIVGIFCVSEFSDETETKVDNTPSYTLQSYADAVEGGVDITFDNDYYISDYSAASDYGTASKIKTKCSVCNGTGKKICSGCKGECYTTRTKDSVNYGSGSVTYTVSSKCVQCNGTGKTPCTACGGDGYIS